MIDTAAQHAERLAWEMASWHSIEMRVKVTYSKNDDVPNSDLAYVEAVYDTVETQTGQRVFHESTLMRNGKKVVEG